jgi:hypothetical protein
MGLTADQAQMAASAEEVTILMPCLNEAETLEVCIRKAMGWLAQSGVAGEVLIADNGSTDGSQEIARRNGARVVDVPTRGYGAALIAGIEAARGRYVIMGDSDDSYDFSNLDHFVRELRAGNELVMGNRFRGGIAPGAMPPLHRFLGNPVLTGIGRLLFRAPCGDFHCGLRGFDRDAIRRLRLEAPGMEFASEMVVKAVINQLRITEVPTTLSPDGRSRPPHLRSWRDGWRHLRFLLMLSPRGVFLYPGLALLTLCGVLFAALMAGDIQLGGITLAYRSLAFVAAGLVLGTQMVSFWVLAKIVAIDRGLLLPDPFLDRVLARFGFETGLIVGVVLVVIGFVAGAAAGLQWAGRDFGPLEADNLMRWTIASTTAIVVGGQIVLTSFLRYLIENALRRGRRSE